VPKRDAIKQKAPHSLDLGTVWNRLFNFTLRLLYPRPNMGICWTGAWSGLAGGLNVVANSKMSPNRARNAGCPFC